MARPMKRIGRWLAASAGALLLLAAGAFALDRLFPPDLSRLADLSALVDDKDGGLLRAFTRAGRRLAPAGHASSRSIRATGACCWPMRTSASTAIGASIRLALLRARWASS